MSEQAEHELTATQHAHWRRFVEFHNAAGTGRALFPNDAEIVTAVDARLAWLEADHGLIPAVVAMQAETSEVLRTIRVEVEGLRAERDHLHARADRATAELLALGREVRQARGEAATLRELCQAVRAALTSEAQDGWAGQISREVRLVERIDAALSDDGLAAKAAAVLAAAERVRDHTGDIDPVLAELDAVVDAYRATLAGKEPTS